MMWSISKRDLRVVLWALAIGTTALMAMMLCGCEKPITSEDAASDDGNLRLTFPTESVQKIAVQLFTDSGEKVLAKSKTQTSQDATFGRLSLQVAAGTYTLVAVSHSSAVSPTIKSPQQVQFTAQDGRKLTDTQCCVLPVTLTDQPVDIALPMQRCVARVRFRFMDDMMDGTTALRFDYTGGSANVNPSTLQGYTKSTQTELRTLSADSQYDIYTFPYMADDGTLSVTVHCLDAQGTDVFTREFPDVPVSRNRMTTLTGQLFSHATAFGFTVEDGWLGETVIHF